jgi:hypothetical protein
VLAGKASPRQAAGQAVSELFLFFSAAVVGVVVMVGLAMVTGIIVLIIGR